MKEISIYKVSVQEDGKLRIYPQVAFYGYQYIYREASEVYWDQSEKCFFSPVPREWDYKNWFGQIVCVARNGLGIILNLSKNTEFISDDPKFKTDIIEANEHIQKWMEENPADIEDMPKERIIAIQNEARKKGREKASIQASAAFHNGELEKAIQLLAPFEKDEELSPSSAKLLAIAKQKTSRTISFSGWRKRRRP